MDPGFGAVIAVGPGGTLVEVVGRASVRLAPLSVEVAREMLSETPAAKLLAGTRGAGPFDTEAAAHAIAAFSRFAHALRDEVAAVEVNPLIVLPQGQGVVGVDAVIEPLA
jgi:succinyl-CoA synthetase beta subunit